MSTTRGSVPLTLSNGTWIRLLGWTVIGMSIYAAYGFRNSRLRPK